MVPCSISRTVASPCRSFLVFTNDATVSPCIFGKIFLHARFRVVAAFVTDPGCGQSYSMQTTGSFRKINPTLETLVTSYHSMVDTLHRAPPNWWKEGSADASLLDENNEEYLMTNNEQNDDDDDNSRLVTKKTTFAHSLVLVIFELEGTLKNQEEEERQ